MRTQCDRAARSIGSSRLARRGCPAACPSGERRVPGGHESPGAGALIDWHRRVTGAATGATPNHIMVRDEV